MGSDIIYTFYSVLGITFIFLMTTLGSSLVFFTRNGVSDKLHKITFGFASGVMIAASVWSLIIPSIERAEELNVISWIPASVGFVLGFIFIFIVNKIYERLGKKDNNGMLFFAISLHNIPEGLAVGLAFGVALQSVEYSLLVTAMGLAVGIGIQNFPEGAAISLPLKEKGKDKFKAFLYGMFSGVFEIIFGIIGLLLAHSLNSIMPWFLSFAAGAMIYVVVDELIPEFKKTEDGSLGIFGFMIGFTIMMILDVALG